MPDIESISKDIIDLETKVSQDTIYDKEFQVETISILKKILEFIDKLEDHIFNINQKL